MEMMKKIAIVVLVGMLVANIHGDDVVNPVNWTRHGGGWIGGAYTAVVSIEGHRYIIARGGAHGIGIVHAHSCPCMAKK